MNTRTELEQLAEPLVPPKNWERLRPLLAKRIALGITKGQMAGAMNCSYSHIHVVERGETVLTENTISRYQDALEKIEEALEARKEQGQ